MARAGAHIPVLPEEVVGALAPAPGETYLDCTAGLGGHAVLIAERLGSEGTVVLCDLDPGNLASAAAAVRALPEPPRMLAFHGNFADAPRRMLEAGLSADCMLADLGFSSGQLEDAARGLSFQREGPLDMRLDPGAPVSAADLVATLPERELEDIIRRYGEERWARQVAQKIVRERALKPITTTAQLAAIVRSVVGSRGGGGHASIDHATRTFQALRIAVNDELGNLDALLEHVERAARLLAGARQGRPGTGQPSWLAPGARVAFLAFHSLEDRPIKQAFARLAEQGLATQVFRKPAVAGPEEVARNPRSRSARLRAVRIGAGP